MTYKEIISEVAESLGLDKKLVDKTYRAYWKTIKKYVTELPLKEDMSKEDFLKLRPNVNIPSLGKLYVTFKRYNYLRDMKANNTTKEK